MPFVTSTRSLLLLVAIIIACLQRSTDAFVSPSSTTCCSTFFGRTTFATTHLMATKKQPDEPLDEPKKGGLFGAVGNFFEELDAFLDDATARRLGNGAAFYGKRRSNFYGKNDSMKKRDKKVFDPMEDYQGPTSSGFFKWMPDENGAWRPVTRMKSKVIEQRSAKND